MPICNFVYRTHDELANTQQANMKIGIVEDEVIIAESIAYSLSEMGYDVPETCCCYEEALLMIEEEKPDLLIIDITLKGLPDGIELGSEVNKKFGIPFIYLTAHPEPSFVQRAKLTQPSAYLLKPFKKNELMASIEIAMHNFLKKAEPGVRLSKKILSDSLFIKQNHFFKKIPYSSVTLLESDHVYVIVHTIEGDKYTVRSSMQTMLDDADRSNFFRVHRSYAVNLAHVEAINSTVIQVNGMDIPVAKTYRDDLLSKINIY